MGKVDPNEAPEGYVAVDRDECYGCEFSYTSPECFGAACCSAHRKDGCNVIFVKRDGKATASWPYDSEGTPV